MTAVWGPLGWMTLHSVATSYPIVAEPSEKLLMASWLDLFRDTITCPSCRGHFTEMLASYRQKFPNMLNTRQDFTVFSFRAHNAVNRRLSKPIYNTVQECMETLKKNVLPQRTAQTYRVAYLNHIARFWRTMQDVSGIVATRKIAEMRKIETEYILPRDTNFAVEIADDIVVLPNGVLSKVEETPQARIAFSPPTGGGFRLTANGLRLRR